MGTYDYHFLADMLDLIINPGDSLTSVCSWTFFNFKKETVLAKKSSNMGSIDTNMYFNVINFLS